ncbi:TetR family transcriptional regulator [Alicyclobacillus fastidiosus]|nr:TetR family transcriptional regulator [Alicyclobacillus fastidiosus]
MQTAYELLKKQGIQGISMRRVAKELDTGPSSLYVYVKNFQELCAFVLDYGLGQLVLPTSAEGSWKERLFDALDAYLMLLFEQPGLAELSLTTIPMGTNSLRLIEFILSALYEGGVSSKAAAWGADLFLFYVSSTAFEHVSWKQDGNDHMSVIKQSFQMVNPVHYPLIASLKEELFSGDTEAKERFRWGLEVILQGILKTRH